MIKIKRGKTSNWRKLNPKLDDGQPGYDREKHKIKIGDGKSPWVDLPYASGLSKKEVLSSETEAKARVAADAGETAVFTYGSKAPDSKITGDVYLQYYESDPETDYIVAYGKSGIWTYQKWYSGIAKCWGTLELNASVQSVFEEVALFYDSSMKQVSYPFSFKEIPSETATLQSPGGVVWLSGRKTNEKKKTGAYSLISPDKQKAATYKITLHAEGFWK